MKRKPLTISIHGQGIDIEAKFTDTRLSDLIAKAIKQATTVTTPPIVEGVFPKRQRYS